MKEEIFNTTKPDFEGTDSPIYGSITQTSKTDSSGIAKSAYTAGTVAGFIEFWYEERSIKESKRGSWLLDWLLRKRGRKKEKLKLRVYVEDPPNEFIKEEVIKHLRNSFPFLPKDRFECVNKKFTTCKKNEFNITYHEGEGMWKECGHYWSNENCEVYYDQIYVNYKDLSNPMLNKRAGKVAAHEMGHSISGHHEKCVMIPNIPDLPSDKCLQFCKRCEKKWEKILGPFD